MDYLPCSDSYRRPWKVFKEVMVAARCHVETTKQMNDSSGLIVFVQGRRNACFVAVNAFSKMADVLMQ